MIWNGQANPNIAPPPGAAEPMATFPQSLMPHRTAPPDRSGFATLALLESG